MISDLLEKLAPDQYLQLRDAFENEFTFQCDVPGTQYWVGVNVPLEIHTLAREGHYAYGEKK